MAGPWEQYAAAGPWTKYGNGDAPTPSDSGSNATFMQDLSQGAGNMAAGLVRGAGSIGATILAPVDMASDAMGGKGLSLESNRQRRADMDAGLQTMGANPDSWLYKGGKLAGEIAGTAGAGGVLAKGAQAAGAAPSFVNALSSGGMALRPAGFIGPVAPNVMVNALTRTAGGVLGGGAMAGLVDPEHAGVGALVGGVLPGVVKAAGAGGNALYDVATNASQRLMQSAIKPTIAQLRTGDSATAVNTLLEYGINPTKAGVNKLKELIDGLNTQIGDSIGASTAMVSKQKVLDALGGVRNKFTNQVSPTSDLKAIQGVADDFAMHPGLPSGDAFPVQQAQEMKQGTYKVLAKKYGQIGTADTEAQKGLARGLKEEISNAVPGIQALNAEESRLITTMGVAERRALMELNKNPMGLAALAGNPASWAMFMADRSAAFKSVAARMINSSNPVVGTAGNKLIGAANNPLLRAGLIEASP